MDADFQHDVFLSHNQADKPRVRRLAAGLRQDKSGFRISDSRFPPEAALLPAALASDWVGLERSTVGRGNLPFRDPANAGRRFVPRLLPSDTSLTWRREIGE
jgi:hypothetical protein